MILFKFQVSCYSSTNATALLCTSPNFTSTASVGANIEYEVVLDAVPSPQGLTITYAADPSLTGLTDRMLSLNASIRSIRIAVHRVG